LRVLLCDGRADRAGKLPAQPWADTIMSEIIVTNLKPEHDWEDTRQTLKEGLASLGILFDDDPALMHAKAECAYRMLRQIVHDLPKERIAIDIRNDLPAEQIELLTRVFNEAAKTAIQVTLCHAVQTVMNHIYDLCTSKLNAVPS
jgi:hypothetical protein